MANMRAAQAVPDGCSEAGMTSTINARSTAITESGLVNYMNNLCVIFDEDLPAFIEKSIQNIDITASQTVSTSFYANFGVQIMARARV